MKRGVLKRGKPIRRRRVRADGPTDKDLDAACRAVVFERDGHKCLKCGKTTNLQWAHVYTRRLKSIRWRSENSMALCGGCHLWWHHEPVEAGMWWADLVPGRYDQLRYARNNVQKVDRKLTLLWLQQELKRLQQRTA